MKRARSATLGLKQRSDRPTTSLRVLATADPQRIGHGPILPGPAPCPWHDRPRGLLARLLRLPRRRTR